VPIKFGYRALFGILHLAGVLPSLWYPLTLRGVKYYAHGAAGYGGMVSRCARHGRHSALASSAGTHRCFNLPGWRTFSLPDKTGAILTHMNSASRGLAWTGMAWVTRATNVQRKPFHGLSRVRAL